MTREMTLARRITVAVLVLLLVSLGCKSKTESSPKPKEPPTPVAPEPVVPSVKAEPESQVDDVVVTEPEVVDVPLGSGATIRGLARWEGKILKSPPLDVQADPYCGRALRGQPLLSEKLTISADSRGVKDVFVYIKSGLPDGMTWPIPDQPVVLDQVGCHYVPHVFGMMAGQELIVRNSDSTSHNVNARSVNNTGFNKGQPRKGMAFSETFKNTELMVRIKCDVHSWMSAYCGVLKHPFFATTDQDGKFTISGLPPGEYVIATWHERFQKGQELVVKVGGGETQELEFVFKRPKK